MGPEPPPHQLTIESVAFATGSGRLVRRDTTVLFDPTGENTKLTSGFDDAADDDEAVRLVFDCLLEADLDMGPFAIVRWRDQLELIVFGDVALHTSIPSAPSVSGASSETWVVHVIDQDRLDAGPSMQVSCGNPAEPGTNLRLGIAACDGFRLDLMLDGSDPDTAGDSAAGTAVDAAPAPPLVAEPEPAPLPHTDSADAGSQADDPHAAIAAVGAVWTEPASANGPAPSLVSATEHSPAPAPEALSEVDPFNVADATPSMPTPAPGDLLEFDAAASTASEPTDDELPPAPPAEIHGLGMLVFENFPDSPVTGPAVIGRRPSATDLQAGIIVDHPEVSRSHAALDIDGFSVFLVDLESRNGTWVQAPDGSPLRRLDAGERVLLADGMLVHLGSVEVAFTWRAHL